METSEVVRKIKQGRVFIYPTDTVYGIGCDAGNVSSVAQIKDIKKRDVRKPLSVIAPSLEWIQCHLVVDVNLDKYLPGPYTVVLKKKDKGFLKHVSSGDSLGIRIPKNKFCDKIRKSGVAFVSTSVNLAGQPPIKSIKEIPKEIKDKIDEVVDEGVLDGRASTLVIKGKEVRR